MRRGAALIWLVSASALAQRGAFSELPVVAPRASLSREVLVDPEQGRVFALTPEHALVARSLETGKRLWSEPAADNEQLHAPAAALGEALLVLVSQPGGIGVRALKQSDGRLLWRSKTITLPEWAQVGPTRPGSFFEAWAVPEGDGARVCWHASRSLMTGIPPKPGAAEAYARDASGAVKVAAAGGVLTEAPPCEKLRTLTVPAEVSALLERGWVLRGAPAEWNGKVVAGTVPPGGREGFTWWRWNASGKPAVEKRQSPELKGRDVSPTLEGLFLVRGEEVDLLRPFEEKSVAVLPAKLPDEGVPVDPGRQPMFTRIADAQRARDRVVTLWRSHGQAVTQGQLVVFDLSGAKVWSQPVIDFESSGPPPP